MTRTKPASEQCIAKVGLSANTSRVVVDQSLELTRNTIIETITRLREVIADPPLVLVQRAHGSPASGLTDPSGFARR
jgi:hypothetical protein